MVHIPAKFRENTSMHFRVTVRKLNVTDGQIRQTDGHTDVQTYGRTDGRGARYKSRPWERLNLRTRSKLKSTSKSSSKLNYDGSINIFREQSGTQQMHDVEKMQVFLTLERFNLRSSHQGQI